MDPNSGRLLLRSDDRDLRTHNPSAFGKRISRALILWAQKTLLPVPAPLCRSITGDVSTQGLSCHGSGLKDRGSRMG
jgi:hypothetical protein